MVLNIDAKFEGKLTCTLKIEMRNLANFYRSTFDNLKIETFVESFYTKQKIYELKTQSRVMCYDNEE